MQIFRRLAVSLVVILLLVTASPAQAALTESQIQAILSLLSSFGADAAVTSNVNASLRGLPVSGTGTSIPVPDRCIYIKRVTMTLYEGSTDATTGGQVSELQRFLATDVSIYPEGSITGYYGPATERAVQRFQAQNGVVTSGSPETTGYGSVGSLTRATFLRICGITPPQPISPLPNDLVMILPNPASGYLTGSSPTLWVDFNVYNYKPVGGEIVEFGDGSRAALGYTTATNTRHDYHTPGTFTVRLMMGERQLAQTQVTVGSSEPQPPPQPVTNVLQMKDKYDYLPAVGGISLTAAQSFCALVDPYGQGGKCAWSGQSIVGKPLMIKDGMQTLKFIKPAAGKNETITIGSGTYAFAITDTAVSGNTYIPLGKYHIYLAKYAPGNDTAPDAIYEASINNTETINGVIYLKWNFTTGEKGSQVLPGNYYIFAAKTETGEMTNVSAYTYIVPDQTSLTSVNLKINGSDGPVNLTDGQRITISWNISPGFASCDVKGVRSSPADTYGGISISPYTSNGSMEVYYWNNGATGSSPVLGCYQPGGISKTDTVQVNPIVTSGITVTAPNGAEVWNVGQQYKVTWTGGDPYGVTAYLEQNTNGQFIKLGVLVEGGDTQPYIKTWTGKLSGTTASDTRAPWSPEPGYYYISLVNQATGATDRSNNPFALVSSSPGTLTEAQIQSIKSLLQSFGAPTMTQLRADNALRGQTVSPIPTPSGITESQYQAVVSLVTSFGASQSILTNLRYALTPTGSTSAWATIDQTTLNPSSGSFVISGGSSGVARVQVFIVPTSYTGPTDPTSLNNLEKAGGWPGVRSMTSYTGINTGSWATAFTGIASDSYKVYVLDYSSCTTTSCGVITLLTSGSLTVWGTSLPVPVINSFTASPTSISAGQSSTLTWNASGTEYGGCYLFIGSGTSSITPSSLWIGSGSFTVTPTITTSYKLYCQSSWKDGYPSVSKSITVTVAGTVTSVPGPKTNAFSCATPTQTGLENGMLACYGLWDFGNEFGEDQYMCPTAGNGYSTASTGCVISTTACLSGKATAVRALNTYAPWHTSSSGAALATDAQISTIALKLATSVDAVRSQLVRIWEYTCSPA